jgi:hypothetical protein
MGAKWNERRLAEQTVCSRNDDIEQTPKLI